MMQFDQLREAKRAQIPAVTHVDGSGRLQTVYRHTNPRSYRLIEYSGIGPARRSC
jgi:carbamoyltransferase